jgi:hypothetical protein
LTSAYPRGRRPRGWGARQPLRHGPDHLIPTAGAVGGAHQDEPTVDTAQRLLRRNFSLAPEVRGLRRSRHRSSLLVPAGVRPYPTTRNSSKRCAIPQIKSPSDEPRLFRRARPYHKNPQPMRADGWQRDVGPRDRQRVRALSRDASAVSCLSIPVEGRTVLSAGAHLRTLPAHLHAAYPSGYGESVGYVSRWVPGAEAAQVQSSQAGAHYGHGITEARSAAPIRWSEQVCKETLRGGMGLQGQVSTTPIRQGLREDLASSREPVDAKPALGEVRRSAKEGSNSSREWTRRGSVLSWGMRHQDRS